MLAEQRPMADRKGGRKGANWLAARTYYVTNSGVTYEDVSKRFGISTRSVEMRASKEKWVELRAGNLRDADQKLRDENANDIADNRARHIRVTGGVLEIIEQLVNDIKTNGFKKADGTDIQSTMSKIEMANVLSAAAHRASEADRLNLGLRPGDASETSLDENSGITIETRRLEPQKIAVNGDGRAIT